MQSTIFIIISWQASYPRAFTQIVQNITCKRPPPHHPAPTPCPVLDSSVSAYLPWNCSLQCHMKRVFVNLNIYIITSSVPQLCDIICVLWKSFNLTSLCSSLPVIQVSMLLVTANVDVTQLHCLSNITLLFHN